MSARHNLDRARYAASLYRIALLRDPDTTRAGRAVVAAFSSLDWSTTSLDEQLEARLVAALPPLPRRWRQRTKPRPPLAALPAAFWRLSPTTRMALGLRLLRGMATPLIADALHLPLTEAQALLLDGVAQAGGLATTPLAEDCRRFRIARLDDLGSEKGHLLGCRDCQAAVGEWERAEAQLSAQLAAAIASVALPTAVDAMLATALDRGDRSTPTSPLQMPWLLRMGLVGLVLVLLGGLLWPHRSNQQAATSAATSARDLLEQARALYGNTPQASGVLHRHWEVELEQPGVRLQAEEWVDSAHPARHRMQLVQDNKVLEWQVSDQQGKLFYHNAVTRWTCGPLPNSIEGRYRQTSMWQLAEPEQQAMRTARWQSGVWALGQRYLDLALAAPALRSLGLTGSGDRATLALSAEGGAFDGSLLLRLDPHTRELREVQLLRTNNGETERRVPWRLVTSEIVEPAAALKSGMLTNYPDNKMPTVSQRTAPILDRICPLVGAEQAISLPKVVAQLPGVLVGLPRLPPSLDRALLVGNPVAQDFTRPSYIPYIGDLLLVYSGPGKRLVFRPTQDAPDQTETREQAGGWELQLQELMPSIWSAYLREDEAVQRNGFEGFKGFHVWAEGWNRADLFALLATVRPLRIDDWINAPATFYEPHPLDPPTFEKISLIVHAVAPRPNESYHLVTARAVRQAPFLATLRDPYHLPAALRPASRRTERWIGLGSDGSAERSLEVTTTQEGKILSAEWASKDRRLSYRGVSNTVEEGGWLSWPDMPDYDTIQLLNHAWQWSTLPDGTILAERSEPFVESPYFRNQASLNGGPHLGDNEPWLADLNIVTITYRRAWSAGGVPRYHEVLATNPRLGKATLAVLDRTVFKVAEWISNLPDSTFTWTPPADAARIGSRRYPRGELGTTSLARLVSAATFPVWAWHELHPDLKMHFARGPWRGGAAPVDFWMTIDEALTFNIAVELHYTTPEGTLIVTQGPAKEMRQLLLQSFPRWTTSELRNVEIAGQTRDLWLLRNADDGRRWAVVEIDEILLFLTHQGTAADMEFVIDHLPELTRFAAAREGGPVQ